MKQVEKSKKRNFGLSKLIKDVECSREKKKVFRITRAIKNL